MTVTGAIGGRRVGVGASRRSRFALMRTRRRTSAASPSGTTTYGWNPLGQLTSVTTAQSTSVYSYGATGMREKSVVTIGTTTKTTESVWDGMRLAAEISPLMSAQAGAITA